MDIKLVCELGEERYFVTDNRIIPVICDIITLKEKDNKHPVMYGFDKIARYYNSEEVGKYLFKDYNFACDYLEDLREKGYGGSLNE